MSIHSRVLVLATVIGVLISSNVLAIENNESESSADKWADLSLEDVMNLKVSVASLFEESERDTPASVSVISKNQWRRQGARFTFDTLRLFPSTMTYTSFGGTQAVAIRGYASSLSANGVEVVLDGMTTNVFSTGTAIYGNANWNLGVLDKIEMIRGPGSAIYGSEAFHGVVSLHTANPQPNTIAAYGSYGSFNSYQADAQFNRRLFGDVELIGAFGLTGNGNMNVDGPYHHYNVNPLTGLAPVPIPLSNIQRRDLDSASAVAKIRYKKSELGLYYNTFAGEGFPGVSSINLPVIVKVGGTSIPLLFPYIENGAQGNLKAKNLTGKLSNTLSINDHINLESVVHASVSTDRLKLGVYPGEVTDNQNMYHRNERAGLSFVAKRKESAATNIRWALGYTFDWYRVAESWTDVSYTRTVPNQPALFGPYAGQALNVRRHYLDSDGRLRRIHALFFQSSLGFWDRFRLIAGARYDFYSDVKDHLSPKAGLIYDLTRDSSLKLLYGNAYRAPAGMELYGNAVIKGSTALQSETIDTYELVYLVTKKDWKANATIYASNWTNGIATAKDNALALQSGGQYVAHYRNAAKNRAYGFELDGTHLVSKKLEANVNLSYTRSFELNEDGSVKLDYGRFPIWIFNWGGTYDVPSTRIALSLFNRHLFLQKSFQFPYATTVTPLGTASGYDANGYSQVPVPTYFRTDFSVTWSFGPEPKGYQVSLNVLNLFNRRNYVPQLWQQDTNGVPEPGIQASLGFSANL